jgi:hypothetical protein
MGSATDAAAWPPLPLEAWSDTATTLHRWLQIVGKIRLGHAPWINHWWHSTLYVTSRGLTTSPMFAGTRSFEIAFDFIDHVVDIVSSDAERAAVALEPQSVAVFHDRLMQALGELGIEARIHEKPNELPDAIPFPEDREHRAYDPDAVGRFWRVLVQADRVMKTFRGRFIGKCSPVHFFWGALDMAVTRFSGRRAPEHPGGIPHLPDRVTREAYSHEVSSCGFWPGSGPGGFPAFYAYAYPEPPGFAAWRARPDAASYSAALREFLLPYDVVREATDPDALLLEFFQSTYDGAATLGKWDREALERR